MSSFSTTKVRKRAQSVERMFCRKLIHSNVYATLCVLLCSFVVEKCVRNALWSKKQAKRLLYVFVTFVHSCGRKKCTQHFEVKNSALN